MARRPKGDKKKGRYVMATDADWARIGEAADKAGFSTSEYVVRCGLVGAAPTGSTDPGLPPSVLRRQARAVLVLERLERLRLKNQGAEDLWETLAAEADSWIEAEADLE